MADHGIRMRRPVHPGEFVRCEILEPLGLSVTRAARALDVTRAALSALLNGRASLSSEMAIRLEKAFGVPLETLMRMQASYDMVGARARAEEISLPRYVASSESSEVQPA